MARRLGAFVEWDSAGLQKLVDIPKEMIDRVEDMTPVMIVVATEDLKPDMLEHLATQGEGKWEPKSPETIKRDRRRGVSSSQPGFGAHGGFAPGIQRSWSKRNAVAFTRDPGAHLFSLGTKQYRNPLGTRAFRWGSKTGGRVSRAKSRIHAFLTSEHQPARPFDYISDEVKARSTRRVGAFIVEEAYRGSV